MSGLFGTLNVGRSGLNTSQAAVNTTSHNISNINTTGYSRQRVNVVTSRPQSNPSYGQIGTGAQIESITRIRDSFLDYQYRSQNSSLGQSTQRSDYLSQIETIFNEPSDSGISNALGEFFSAWQDLSNNPTSTANRTSVVQQTVTLTNLIQSTYRKFEDLQNNAQSLLKTNAVDVNSLLDRIQNLNDQIKSVSASGQTPNDLMDSRDVLLDELSTKFGITIDKTKYDGINVSANDDDGMVSSTLVSSDGTGVGARLSYVSSVDSIGAGVYEISYYKYGDSTDNSNLQKIRVSGLTDEDKDNLLNNRLIWASTDGTACKADGSEISYDHVIDVSELKMFKQTTGEIAGNQTSQADIKKYMSQLDNLAAGIAYSVNAIHSGTTGDVSDSNLLFFVNGDTASYNSGDGKLSLSGNPESGITAKNISINTSLFNNVSNLNVSESATTGEGDGKRALAIAQIKNTMIAIDSKITSRETLSFIDGSTTKLQNNINGATIDDYFTNIIDQLGIQSQEAKREVTNQTKAVESIDQSRQANSGVSLDEELSSLIQFQHAYSANAKIISTIDELLDVVVNGLKK